MDIEYLTNHTINAQQFQSLLRRSTLALRRPVDDLACLDGMLKNANLIISAWHQGELVGIVRCVTDFYYCCYLSDLAVDEAYQKKGIGIALQSHVKNHLNEMCKIILIASPKAASYYPNVGYEHNDRCWVLNGDKMLEVQR